MKAVLFAAHGGPEVLRLGDAPDPVAGPGEVVVDIHAASVNAADYKVRLGGGGYSNLKFPHILGRDFSGVVSAVGPGVTDLKVGDAVFGVTDPGHRGLLCRKDRDQGRDHRQESPTGSSHAEAAAMALTSLTAIWALEDTAKLKARRDDPDPGRRRRRRRVRDPARQAYRRDGDHHRQRAQPRLRQEPRRRSGRSTTTRGFHQGRPAIATSCSTRSAAKCRSRSYDVLKPGGRLVWIAAGAGRVSAEPQRCRRCCARTSPATARISNA